MKEFSIESHTADVIIAARGSSYEKLFSAALEGLCFVIKHDYNMNNLNYETSDLIRIESIDRSALLIDFLSKALTIMHSEGVILFYAKFFSLEETFAEVIYKGCRADGFNEDVKAVTYHGSDIVINEGGIYQSHILLDI
jgi:SHS2 domain-containing protein